MLYFSTTITTTGYVSSLTAEDIPGKNTTGEGIFLFVPIGEVQQQQQQK